MQWPSARATRRVGRIQIVRSGVDGEHAAPDKVGRVSLPSRSIVNVAGKASGRDSRACSRARRIQFRTKGRNHRRQQLSKGSDGMVLRSRTKTSTTTPLLRDTARVVTTHSACPTLVSSYNTLNNATQCSTGLLQQYTDMPPVLLPSTSRHFLSQQRLVSIGSNCAIILWPFHRSTLPNRLAVGSISPSIFALTHHHHLRVRPGFSAPRFRRSRCRPREAFYRNLLWHQIIHGRKVERSAVERDEKLKAAARS